MRKIILSILLIFAYIHSNAQLPDYYKNLEKYWYYRYRLVNDFLKIGDGAGESIPAQKRVIGAPNVDQNGNITSYQTGYLKWGDATIDLGDYMSALALEWRQLDNNGCSTDRTGMELSYALKAFKRLDDHAEGCMNSIDNFYPPNVTTTGYWGTINHTHNGFFIRDDVPWLDFIDPTHHNLRNYLHFNRPGITSVEQQVEKVQGDKGINFSTEFDLYRSEGSAFAGRYGGPDPLNPGHTMIGNLSKDFYNNYIATDQYSSVHNGWSNLNTSISRLPCEESQDQLASIWPGLALTRKFVDDQSLKNAAEDEMYLTIGWIANGTTTPWVIKNPVTTQCVYGVTPSANPNCSDGGAYFSLSAIPAVDALIAITGTGYNFLPFVTLPLNHGFQLLQKPILPQWNVDDILFPDSYAAFANDYSAGGYFGQPPGLNWKIFNTTYQTIRDHSFGGRFRAPHLPLLHRLNFPNSSGNLCPQCHSSGYNGYTMPSYEDLLNNAPPCGPYCYNHGSWTSSHYWNMEWSGNDRLNEPYHRVDCGYPNVKGPDDADFNGLDYMYLFNLYALVYSNYIQKIFNSYYCENFKTNYPEGTLGTMGDRLELDFLQYVSLINTIAPDGYVNFRCGQAIELLPGFEVKGGGVVNCFIQDYTCAGGYNNGEDNFYHYARHQVVNETKGLWTPFEYGKQYISQNEVYSEIPPVDTNGGDTLSNEQLKYYLDSLENSFLNSGDSLDIAIYQHFYDTSGNGSLGNKHGSTPNNNTSNSKSPKASGKSQIINGEWITVYPNPNFGNFTIELSQAGSFDLRVMNVLGQVVYSDKLSNQNKKTIELDPGLSPGTYTVQLTNENVRYVEKITIVK